MRTPIVSVVRLQDTNFFSRPPFFALDISEKVCKMELCTLEL